MRPPCQHVPALVVTDHHPTHRPPVNQMTNSRFQPDALTPEVKIARRNHRGSILRRRHLTSCCRPKRKYSKA
jgi:hypothetical protein